MFAVTLLARLGALMVLLVGFETSKASGVLMYVGIIVFVIGVGLFEKVCIWADAWRRMPYRWHCPICKNKGQKIGMEGSIEELIQRFREDHNRTVHLREP